MTALRNEELQRFWNIDVAKVDSSRRRLGASGRTLSTYNQSSEQA